MAEVSLGGTGVALVILTSVGTGQVTLGGRPWTHTLLGPSRVSSHPSRRAMSGEPGPLGSTTCKTQTK